MHRRTIDAWPRCRSLILGASKPGGVGDGARATAVRRRTTFCDPSGRRSQHCRYSVHGARANYCASGVPRVQGDRTQTRTTTRRLIKHHLRRRPGMASAEERLVCTRPTPDLPVPLVASAVWSGTSKVGLGCTRASTSTSVMGIHVTSSGSVNRCNFTGRRGFCGDYNMRHGFP
jgi:hypothetical protein